MNPLVALPPVPVIPPETAAVEVGTEMYKKNVRSWVSGMYGPSALQREKGADPQETVITSDEISLEKMSLTPGRVTIELTDEEMQRIRGLDEEAAQHQ